MRCKMVYPIRLIIGPGLCLIREETGIPRLRAEGAEKLGRLC